MFLLVWLCCQNKAVFPEAVAMLSHSLLRLPCEAGMGRRGSRLPWKLADSKCGHFVIRKNSFSSSCFTASEDVFIHSFQARSSTPHMRGTQPTRTVHLFPIALFQDSQSTLCPLQMAMPSGDTPISLGLKREEGWSVNCPELGAGCGCWWPCRKVIELCFNLGLNNWEITVSHLSYWSQWELNCSSIDALRIFWPPSVNVRNGCSLPVRAKPFDRRACPSIREVSLCPMA